MVSVERLAFALGNATDYELCNLGQRRHRRSFRPSGHAAEQKSGALSRSFCGQFWIDKNSALRLMKSESDLPQFMPAAGFETPERDSERMTGLKFHVEDVVCQFAQGCGIRPNAFGQSFRAEASRRYAETIRA
jgi:hypothetical protein